MTNDLVDAKPEAVPCVALSNNDSYLMSASGGKISLFNMMTFKVVFETRVLTMGVFVHVCHRMS